MSAPVESRIYLASRSPRRRELLTQINVRFDLLLFRSAERADPEVDETPLPGELPEDYVLRVASAKAVHGQEQIRKRHLLSRPVLAADTALDLDGRIIGKPRDETDAHAILTRLSGRSHRVLTAVAVATPGRIEHALSVSEVSFRELAADEIKRYVACGEPMDKAGAYGLQGRGAMFVAEIRGSPSGIVGLPLCETVLLLRRFGYPL
ncbi:septum formation inhibitor Maf [Denitratisoma sp. DHT3]|uniref:Maf family protein n=1 Tax=Denitratisoma sp. DHT3 TaxID=1981880 RepID=UPI001198B846|nr:nucleoside triphosphate pyrophosphatase [Denitratisoma sp. DHT3]QDX81569.1 septum formation inhibitor Maf [Denitratisoma sp. DHT3]